MDTAVHTPPTDGPTPAGGPPRRRGVAHRLARWLGAALATVLVLLVAIAPALWWWSGQPGSAPRVLGWVAAWSQAHPQVLGTLEIEGARGSLRGEAHIRTLRWQHDGLAVHASDVHLPWNDAFWWGALRGRGLHLGTVDIGALRIVDQRPPSPAGEPPQALALPWPVSVSWRIDRLDAGSEAPPAEPTLRVGSLHGRYRYEDGNATPGGSVPADGTAPRHRLDIEQLMLAEGRYRAHATLGAHAPMPLHLSLHGELAFPRPDATPLPLRAEATVEGTLSGADARLQVQASVQPAEGDAAPPDVALQARADVRPWAAAPELPLHSAGLNVRGLDLSLFWPSAPRTAITGTARAAPDGARWRARIDLRNTRPGPWDQGALPLEALRARVNLENGRWQVDALDATLGGGQLGLQGHVDTGAAGPFAFADAHWRLQAELQAIDPSRLWQSLAPQRIGGHVLAEGDAAGPIGFDVNLQPGPPPAAAGSAPLLGPTRIEGRWFAQAQRLAIAQLHTTLAGARLQASGELDPTRWHAVLDARAEAPGLALQLRARQGEGLDDEGHLDVHLTDARALQDWWRRLATTPLIGMTVRHWLEATAPWSDGQLDGSARLRLRWQGHWPLPSAATAPAGPWPSLEGELAVPRLRLRDTEARLWTVQDLRVGAQGTLQRLQLTWTVQAGQGPWTLAASGSARWPDEGAPAAGAPATSGRLQIEHLALAVAPVADGPAAWPGGIATLERPLALRWRRRDAAPPTVDVGAGALDWQWSAHHATAPARLAWEGLRWDEGVLRSRGRLEGLSMGWIHVLSGDAAGLLERAGLAGDLQLGAQWDVDLPLSTPADWRLSAGVYRTGGDLTVRTGSGADAVVAARVREASVGLSMQGEAVRVRLRWDSDRLGHIEGTLLTRIDPTASAPMDVWPASAPLDGALRIGMPQVGVWSMLAPPGWRIRGSLDAQARIGGTRAQPDWHGRLQADDLALFSAVEGIFLRNGRLRASADGEQIVIDSLYFEGLRGAAEGGTLQASGIARWRERPATTGGPALLWPDITLQVRTERLRISAHPDRRLVLSGDAQAHLWGDTVEIRGRLVADEALIALPDEFTPSLDADVVVRSGQAAAANGARVEPGRPIRTDVRIDIGLGEHFEVRGRGLQAMLGGQLQVLSTPADPVPRVLGDVAITEGSYRAYGQQLRIETGTLRFTGPYDDPTLDIVAVRPQGRSDQRVGVRVSGSAQLPTLRLFAEPDMPDGEKLAWLLLGRPARGTGAEAAILQQAALALLSTRGQDPGNQLARRLGVDDISLQGQTQNSDGTVNAAAVSIGKQLSDRLYISYERSLIGTLGSISLFYELSRHLTLRGRAGEENAIDLVFTRRYD